MYMHLVISLSLMELYLAILLYNIEAANHVSVCRDVMCSLFSCNDFVLNQSISSGVYVVLKCID